MEPYLGEAFGNPAGSHGVSRRAKNAVEEARDRVAGVLDCRPGEVVFTSGGTEADNLAIKGRALLEGGGIVTIAIEHEAVLEPARFCERLGSKLSVIGVDRSGVVDPERVVQAVDGGTSIVSVMSANNETGAIQPVAEIADLLGGRAVLHTDAVQSAVSEPLDLEGLDLVSIAGHKLGGPKGVGVLFVREGIALEPVLHGGGQELGRRSGTLNVAGIVGMAAALELAVADRDRFRNEIGAMRDAFESALADFAIRTIDRSGSLVQHSHLRFPGHRNETVLVLLDRAGVAASAGAACASGAATVSHVLSAMGVSTEEARECLRFSFGWDSTMDETRTAAELIREVLA